MTIGHQVSNYPACSTHDSCRLSVVTPMGQKINKQKMETAFFTEIVDAVTALQMFNCQMKIKYIVKQIDSNKPSLLLKILK